MAPAGRTAPPGLPAGVRGAGGLRAGLRTISWSEGEGRGAQTRQERVRSLVSWKVNHSSCGPMQELQVAARRGVGKRSWTGAQPVPAAGVSRGLARAAGQGAVGAALRLPALGPRTPSAPM